MQRPIEAQTKGDNVLLNETECTIELGGRQFSNRGAYINENFAMVYIVRNEDQAKIRPQLKGSVIKVTDWNGNRLGAGLIVSAWVQYGQVFGSYNMVSVRFVIDGIVYAGRFNYDNGQLVRAKRIKTGKVG